MIANVIMLWGVNKLPEWRPAFLLPSYSQVLWIINLSLWIQIGGNVLLAIVHRRVLHHLLQMSYSGVSVMTLIWLLRVFPVNFSVYTGGWANWLFRVALILGLIGSVISGIVHLVLTVKALLRPAAQDAPGTLDQVQGFLRQRRLALIGLSRQPQDFSRSVFRELRAAGYDVVPVNLHLTEQEVEGQRCFARIQDVEPPVDGALIMTPAAQSAQVAGDCLDAGIRHIWLHQGAGPGAVSPEAVARCRDAGVTLVAGQCPLMFLPKPAWFHRAHGALKQLNGTYPAHAACPSP